MNHTSHDHEPGGKGADSEALPLVTGQEAQLEKIQLQALGDHLAWQSELRNGRGGNGPQGYPRRQTVLLEGVKEIQRRHRSLGEQLLHESPLAEK